MSGLPYKWEEPEAEEPWKVEIEYDCFTIGEPFVVSIFTEHDEGDGSMETLATPSAEQAREMAAALLRSADAADKANARPVHRGAA